MAERRQRLITWRWASPLNRQSWVVIRCRGEIVFAGPLEKPRRAVNREMLRRSVADVLAREYAGADR